MGQSGIKSALPLFLLMWFIAALQLPDVFLDSLGSLGDSVLGSLLDLLIAEVVHYCQFIEVLVLPDLLLDGLIDVGVYYP